MPKEQSFETILSSIKSFVQKNLPQRDWDWQSILLVIVLVQTASTRLVISEWVPNLIIIESVSLFAVTLGLLLGFSNFTGKISAWIAVEYALLVIPMSLLTIVDKTSRTDDYMEDVRNLLVRLFDSTLLFFKNQPIYDTIFFILLTSAGFWLIGCYVGYRLTRHNSFLDAIFGPGLVMLIIQIYDPWVKLRAWGLAFFIFISLILLGRIRYLENKKVWKNKRVFQASDAEPGFARSILYTAALTVFIAWALPGAIASIKPISQAWRNFTDPFTERFSNAVSALDSPYGASTSSDFYGSELRLGNSAPVSDTPVLFIEAQKDESNVLRYYWRGRIYDTYQDGQWVNLNSQRITFNPNIDEIDLKESSAHVEVDLKITINFPRQELLYAPSEVNWFSRDGKLIITATENEGREVLGMVADPGLVAGDSYQVRAMIATPSIQELRGAGTQYPKWVSESYLQVPKELEIQLKELAQNITAPYTNPFDKAQAITSYLRTTIKYETNITGTPPSGEDPLLWVLFDHRKGFCMYSASAEVLMLRTLGIPARMAVGFAEGTYDEERDRYTVARMDAHAWPEVYFPQIGWIEFEPTGNQQPLDRPLAPRDESDINQANAIPANNGPQAEAQNGNTSDSFNPSLDQSGEVPTTQSITQSTRLFPLILLLLCIALAVILSKRYALAERLPVYLVKRYDKNGTLPPGWIAYWAYWAQLLPIEKNYQTINLCLHWLGIKQPSHNTPKERAATLTRVIPSAKLDIQNLSAEYQNAVFASHPANLKMARRASLNLLFKSWQARTFHYKEISKRRYN